MRLYQVTDIPFRSLDRLFQALTDPTRCDRAAIATLAAYLFLWTLYAIIAKSSQDIHVDMAELIVWSRDLAFGFRKHPPLAAFIINLWFHIFPIAAWAYYLLSALVATLALWIAWHLFADYLDAEKRVVGVALLTFIPFFNFLALTFNVNTILMPLWAATTLWFERSYRTRKVTYAALAGIGAAACLYAKYWSIFLLVGLGVAAVLHVERRIYFHSWAPWVTAAACLLLLIPHIDWLIGNDFIPFRYAIELHGEKPLASATLAALKYVRDCILYVAVPVILTFLAAWPSLPTFLDIVWPSESARRLIALLFWSPLLSPVVAALLAGFQPVALWSMSMWTLLPVLLLSPPAVTLGPRKARNILALAVVIPVLSLIASPAVAIIIHRCHAIAPAASHGKILAKRVDEIWAATTNEPLRFVDGPADLAYEVAAYAQDRPRALAEMPPVRAEKVSQRGKVVVCYAETECARSLITLARETDSRLTTITISRKYFGTPGPAQQYVFLVVPPKPQIG